MGATLLEPVRGVGRARAQARGLSVTAHRPWPLPGGPWVMGQTWEDLLFAHWRVPVDALRRVVPAGLSIDAFDGTGWLGVTPFVVRALRPRLLPPLPAGSRFAEVNVRTYVTVGGRPGVWFFSLDAASRTAVVAARRAYALPYFRADMAVGRRGGRVRYRSRRVDGRADARLEGEYGPVGDVFTARAGTLEHFLTERYCLYTLDARRRVRRADIHHPPWPLQAAAADLAVNTMGASAGVELAGEPLLHYARRQDVVVWPPVLRPRR